jgi:hypothetical protein
MSRTAIRRAILTAALVVPSVAVAQKPSVVVAQKPTAQSLFDKHAAAVGGIAAHKAAPARTESGTAEITFAGISAGYERKTIPGRMLMVFDVANYGQVMQGFDGTVAWGVDPQQGPRKEPAATSADAAASLTPTASLWEPGTYSAAEVLDSTQFANRKAWPVKIVGKTGRVRTVYYDDATGLKLGEVIKQEGGDQKILYDEYKPFGALKLPTKVTQGTPDGDIILHISAVKFDPIEASVFALPDVVKALP